MGTGFLVPSILTVEIDDLSPVCLGFSGARCKLNTATEKLSRAVSFSFHGSSQSSAMLVSDALASQAGPAEVIDMSLWSGVDGLVSCVVGFGTEHTQVPTSTKKVGTVLGRGSTGLVLLLVSC